MRGLLCGGGVYVPHTSHIHISYVVCCTVWHASNGWLLFHFSSVFIVQSQLNRFFLGFYFVIVSMLFCRRIIHVRGKKNTEKDEQQHTLEKYKMKFSCWGWCWRSLFYFLLRKVFHAKFDKKKRKRRHDRRNKVELVYSFVAKPLRLLKLRRIKYLLENTLQLRELLDLGFGCIFFFSFSISIRYTQM